MSLARLPRVQKRRASRSNDNRPSGNAPRSKHANRRLQRLRNRRRNNKPNEQRFGGAAPALYCLNFLFLSVAPRFIAAFNFLHSGVEFENVCV
jgi:hypothetical protein